MANTSNAFRNALFLLIFNNDDTGLNKIGDATGIIKSTADGTLQVALHTADPGLGGSMTTNEASYTGYARQTIARTPGGFTVSTNTATNVGAVTFPTNTGTQQTITHISVGYTSGDTILFTKALDSSLVIDPNDAPNFPAGNIDFTIT